MKKTSILIILLAGVIAILSFKPTSVNNIQKYNSNEIIFLPITISFDLIRYGSPCVIHVEVTISTTTGNGIGHMTTYCPNSTPTTIRFTVFNASVSFAGGKITVQKDNLIEFVDDATDVTVDIEESLKEELAKGISDNGTFD